MHHYVSIATGSKQAASFHNFAITLARVVAYGGLQGNVYPVPAFESIAHGEDPFLTRHES